MIPVICEAIPIVTRKEIAERANVSESTVTRVLNGGYVSEETRKKVRAIIEELNYRPNALAQGLRTRKTYQIACIVLSIDNPFYSQILLGVEEIANRHGYVLTIYSSTVVERNWRASFFTGRHDGIILLSINQKHLLEHLDGVRVPIVAYSDSGPHPDLPYVSVDLQDAVERVIQHLVSLGHTHIGYIGTDDTDKDENPRLRGFLRGMKTCGISVKAERIQLVSGTGTMESGYTGMAEIHRKFPRITALVTMNDLIAFGAMRWMQDNGIRIPQDISIVGCDIILYILDTLRWIPSKNPELTENPSGQGINYHGVTLFDKNSSQSLIGVFTAWRDLFKHATRSSGTGWSMAYCRRLRIV